MSKGPSAMYDEKTIQLDQFLKVAGLVQSGGHAKQIIQSGAVVVNGEVEVRRGRKLQENDVVVFEGQSYVVPEIED
ncbi:RNA-binding S4 domain-containing protein [soil metagenome]